MTKPVAHPARMVQFSGHREAMGEEQDGRVYFQHVFITESKGCSWATRLWRQHAIVARRVDHSEIAELTGLRPGGATTGACQVYTRHQAHTPYNDRSLPVQTKQTHPRQMFAKKEVRACV